MFSSSIVAASGVTSGYSADLDVGIFTDKAGTRYGFSSDPNSTPPWEQLGTGTATAIKYGGLSNDIVNLGGTDYRIVSVGTFLVSQSIILLHPDQNSTTPLPADLFTSISTDLGTLNASDVSSRGYSAIGSSSYKVTTYFWQTGVNGAVFTNIFGTSETTRTLTITE